MQHSFCQTCRETIALVLLLCPAAFSQSITASLQGRVSDRSGAVLTKASVTATNTETGLIKVHDVR